MRQRKIWVFDLDNTLHNASMHIFPQINRSMTDYLERHLQVDRDEANRLRIEYWRRYGATLRGLVRHHGTDPAHFLFETHRFPDLPALVVRQAGLRSALARLSGRKIVFSNAPAGYATAVLRILGIEDLFDEIFSIENSRYRPKPDSFGFFRIFRKMRLRPAQCVMVEDSLENLKTAKKLGMKTVWVSGAASRPPYVDLNVASIGQLARRQSRLISSKD